jgi:hypothetical protein
LQVLSTLVKPKQENLGKETKFGVAQVVVIILQHWVLVNLTFQLLESKDKDEEEDNFSIKPNPNMKKKGLIMSF